MLTCQKNRSRREKHRKNGLRALEKKMTMKVEKTRQDVGKGGGNMLDKRKPVAEEEENNDPA